MFQRFAVTYTTSASQNECFTKSLVDLDEGDAREIVARQIACREFGRAEMADHVEVDLTPIGQPTTTL